MSKTHYGDPRRLADVMALIQVLAQGPYALRTESGLAEQLRGKPKSGPHTWMDLAEAHREFFVVRGDQEQAPDATLIWRLATPPDAQGAREPLDAESTAKLLEIAVNLHDAAVRRSQRFNFLVPLGVAVIAGLFSVLAVVLKIYYRLPPA